MEMEAIVAFVNQYVPLWVQYPLMAFGSLVVLGFAYIKATPNLEDDAWLAKLEQKPIVGFVLRLLRAFSPQERKQDTGIKIEEKK